jgi:arylsulfatase A-like enzyme
MPSNNDSPLKKSAPILALFLVGVSLLSDGCSKPESFEAERFLESLLNRTDRRTDKVTALGRPVQTGSLTPVKGKNSQAGMRTSLLMASGSEVIYQIPEDIGSSAYLRFATGVDHSSYTGDDGAEVRFVVLLRGEPVFHSNVPYSSSLPVPQRRWEEGEISLAGGGRLSLRVVSDTPGAKEVKCGFAELSIIKKLRRVRAQSAPDAPNVVMIVLDTLRSDRLGTYGYDRNTSPNIDALGEKGVVFDRSFAASPWTWPSTASLLTTLSPPQHGVIGSKSSFLVDEIETIAESFLQHGVATAAFSANPLICSERNFDQGFEGFFEYAEEAATPILSAATQWVRENSDNRFFLYIHLLDTHTPYRPDPVIMERFGPKAPNGYSEQMLMALHQAQLTDDAADTSKLDEFMDHYSNLYDAEIATLDQELGVFFRGLSAMGLDDRTVIAITSDHGEEFMDHSLVGHGRQFFSESVEVPLIIAGPGIPSGARIEARVENRFLAPTLLAAANLSPPASMESINLLEATRESNPDDETIFFTTSLGRWPNGPLKHRAKTLQIHGCLKERWLYVWAPEQPKLREELHQLFDLYSDTEAKHNVATRNVVRMSSLKAEVIAWLEAGAATRVDTFTDQALAKELMRGLGYIGEQEEPAESDETSVGAE